jgi:Tfp pilus assembly protein PilF
MTHKELNEKEKEIIKLIQDDNEDDASILFAELANLLYSQKQYDDIIKVFNKASKITSDKTLMFTFELAYSYVELKDENSAEKVYEYILSNEPKNSAILNNLSNIKKRKRKFKEAFDLISRAIQIEPDDEIITNNYDNLNQIVSEQREREQKFKHSLTFLERENDFVVNKLKLFIQNAKKDDNYNNGVLPIAKWKFKVFMQTDNQKSESLREQWLDKNYILDTGQKGNYSEIVYEINPFLEKAFLNLKKNEINQNWIKVIELLNTKSLEEINYFRNLKRIKKLNKEFKSIIKRDYDELTFNYMAKNNKTTIILSGSIIETLLIYYLKKKKINIVAYEINNKKITKELYEATLNDLLQYLEQNKELEKQYVHLGNISRIYRNYVHPGKELRESEELDDSKANLCYISASELINNLI